VLRLYNKEQCHLVEAIVRAADHHIDILREQKLKNDSE
jgi:hypothetical protein